MTTDIIKSANEIAQSQFIFSILFIILLAAIAVAVRYVFINAKTDSDKMSRKLDKMNQDRQNYILGILDETKKESKVREEKLFEQNDKLVQQIDRYNDNLQTITQTQIIMQETQHKMQQNLESIEQRVERIENNRKERD